MPQHTRDQHYVSQFYLKGFAGSDGKLRRLDAARRKLAPHRSPRSVCQEDYFYGLRTGARDGASDTVESLLTDRENELAPQVQRIEEALRSGSALDEEGKRILSTLMSMLHLRGTGMRSNIQEMHSQLVKGTLRIVAGMTTADAYIRKHGSSDGTPLPDEKVAQVKAGMQSGTFDVTADNEAHLSFLNEIDGFANLLAAQNWTILINKSELPFVTTCSPVTEYAPEGWVGPFPPAFINCVHCFALSPAVAIIAREPTQDGGATSIEVLSSDQAERVHQINVYLANQSPFVFAKSDEPLLRLLADLALGR